MISHGLLWTVASDMEATHVCSTKDSYNSCLWAWLTVRTHGRPSQKLANRQQSRCSFVRKDGNLHKSRGGVENSLQ